MNIDIHPPTKITIPLAVLRSHLPDPPPLPGDSLTVLTRDFWFNVEPLVVDGGHLRTTNGQQWAMAYTGDVRAYTDNWNDVVGGVVKTTGPFLELILTFHRGYLLSMKETCRRYPDSGSVRNTGAADQGEEIENNLGSGI